MIDWLAGSLFRSVSNWLPESVAAVAGNALKGAVYGAIVGAGQAAITGGDIKRGALRGAAAGGVAAGVVSSFGQMMGGEYSTENQAASLRESSKPGQNIATVGGRPNTTQEYMENTYGERQPRHKESDEKWWQKDTDGGKLAAGILQGSAISAGNYFTARQSADAAEKLSDKEHEQAKDMLEYQKELNKPTPPVDFKIPKMNVSVRSWWEERAMERSMA